MYKYAVVCECFVLANMYISVDRQCEWRTNPLILYLEQSPHGMSFFLNVIRSTAVP